VNVTQVKDAHPLRPLSRKVPDKFPASLQDLAIPSEKRMPLQKTIPAGNINEKPWN
jgi:hypothetical protein